jgi:hypothetical protein
MCQVDPFESVIMTHIEFIDPAIGAKQELSYFSFAVYL